MKRIGKDLKYLRIGKNLRRLSELMVMKTLTCSSDKLNWSALLALSGLRRSTLSSSLKSLVKRGLVERSVDANVYPPAVYYRLTEKGFEELDLISEFEEAFLETEPLPEPFATLKEFAYNYFRMRGLALDIGRSGVSLKRLFLTFGLLPMAELVKAYKLTDEGKTYLEFLSKIYVDSVDLRALTSMPIEKQFETVMFFWRLCSPNAYSCSEQMLSFMFDYPRAYGNSLTPKLEQILVKAFPFAEGEEMLRKAVFTRLKAISHPIRERRQLIDKIWK